MQVLWRIARDVTAYTKSMRALRPQIAAGLTHSKFSFRDGSTELWLGEEGREERNVNVATRKMIETS
ncbi:hypothetical protein [Ensifer sp. BR816]|uniref:hypothetical protein n=1 Tax=Rhizobium sp. (strain BR816) TaxID=1057002 RepID=UPI00037241BB|nr:hypothetical protein [Ensifer sp. BR816]